MPGTKPSAAERILDLAIEFTFPASDPIAVDHAFLSARKRDQTFERGESVMAAVPAREAKVSKALNTPSTFSPGAVAALAEALNRVLADSFALYLKTKNFHWHVSGPHFRDYHLMFDEQAAQILAATDGMAERVRKIGGTTLRSIGHVAKLQHLKDNNADFVAPDDMLRELIEDNKALVGAMRQAHEIADDHGDVASASLLENWIDEGELRVWFLFEASRQAV
jgi:starvation-inducible DNA-binding protein